MLFANAVGPLKTKLLALFAKFGNIPVPETLNGDLARGLKSSGKAVNEKPVFKPLKLPAFLALPFEVPAPGLDVCAFLILSISSSERSDVNAPEKPKAPASEPKITVLSTF